MCCGSLRRVRWLLAVLLLGSSVAHASAVLLLRQQGFATEEERLLESLRIYTRDLDARVIDETAPRIGLDRVSLDQVAARAKNVAADLVVWIGRQEDGQPVTYLFRVGAFDLRETEIEAHSPEAVALKVRTLLTAKQRK